MDSPFISLTIIAFIAAITPMLAKLIPRQLVPEPVFLIVTGAVLGPNALKIIHSNSEAIAVLSELGCAFLFLLAGYEIDPKALVGHDGKKGFRTWVITFLIGLGTAVIMPDVASGHQGLIAMGLVFTTTALGALMPILTEREMTGTRVGDLVISYGTWGELATVIAVAILLSARNTWKTAMILGVLLWICVWIALLGNHAVENDHPIYKFIKSKAETTSQTMMRVTILLMIVLVAFSAVFKLDIVLGAFAAGFVLRSVTSESNKQLELKLNGLAHGFLIPLFFVVSGCGINLYAVKSRPVLLVIFIAALILIRTIPIVISLSLEKDEDKKLSLHHRFSVAFYCTTALPLIVAITGIAVNHGVMDKDIASVLVAAGAISIFLMPYLGALTYTVVDAEPLQAVVEIFHSPKEITAIIHRHVEIERSRAKAYRKFAAKKVDEQIEAITNPEEKRKMKELIDNQRAEDREFFREHKKKTEELHKKHKAEFIALYGEYHNGERPDHEVVKYLKEKM